MIGKMIKPNNKIVLLDYSSGDVVVLENIPTQEYIDVNHDGDWLEWLFFIEDKRDDMPRIGDCHWMHTTNYELKTIKL